MIGSMIRRLDQRTGDVDKVITFAFLRGLGPAMGAGTGVELMDGGEG